jgi:dihydrofolate reductase
MRKIIAAEFMSLDGVVEAADQWHMPYFCEEMGAAQSALMDETDTMLLGRRTYEEFAAAWPGRTAADFGPLAAFMNDTPKLVVSTTLQHLTWRNSSLVKGDLAGEVTRLKESTGRTIFVPGSATLVQSLLRANLLDELRLFVDPVLVGAGKRLCESDNGQVPLHLASCATFPNGVLSLTYVPADS